MNEMIRQHENSCKLLEINLWMGKFYHGNLVEPGRQFIKAGSVLKVNRTELQTYMCFPYYSLCNIYLNI
jgi:hypothetical protein